jgi:hypothetical protein
LTWPTSFFTFRIDLKLWLGHRTLRARFSPAQHARKNREEAKRAIDPADKIQRARFEEIGKTISDFYRPKCEDG